MLLLSLFPAAVQEDRAALQALHEATSAQKAALRQQPPYWGNSPIGGQEVARCQVL